MDSYCKVSEITLLNSSRKQTNIMNFTVTLPPNAQNHGDPSLICLPPLWTDYIVFFATNYFAHAATLISHPGESFWETLISTANALFIPGSGALRAFRFLVLYISPLLSRSGSEHGGDPEQAARAGDPAQAARFGDLAQAARAGALCMIVEEGTPNKYHTSQHAFDFLGFFFGDHIRLVPPARDIHGVYNMPQPSRWILIEVPPNMPLSHYEPSRREVSDGSEIMGPAPAINMTLAKSRNIPKILINILQVIWGIITLYKSRGDQITLYGYGAFGLTVAPYTIMGIINLATNLLRPEYANMYLVHTPPMENAWEENADFMGIVAKVNEADFETFVDGGLRGTLTPPVFFTLNMLGYLIICILPIALVGGFTGFQAGENVKIAISWVLGWLIIGSVSSLWVRVSASLALHPIWEVILVIPLWIPAIGGFAVVAQMLNDFGICTIFSS